MNKPLQLTRAYALLNVKAVDDAKRVITGTATTPTTDRVGDIVEPLGVEYKNPMPLLWQHDHDKPVGEVRFKKPTEAGVEFEAKLVDPEKATSNNLKERLLEAWDSVKLGLVKGVSIGFMPIEYNFMKEGGIRIEKSEVYELSLVTIPANAEATIATIKALDSAATGKKVDAETVVINIVKSAAAAASGGTIEKKPNPASRAALTPSAPKDAKKMPRSIAEQLAGFENKRAANVARMSAIMAESDEGGSTLTKEQQDEFDNLDTENGTIDGQLVRLKKMDELNKQQLIEVDPVEEQRKAALPAGAVRRSPVVTVKANVPKGTAFIRLAMAMAAGRGDLYRSIRYAKESIKWGGWDNTPEVLQILDEVDDIGGMMQKAAIGPGTTYDTTWASPLIAYTQMASEFVELLRPATIIGRIPNLRRVPFNIQIPATTAGSTVGWVGEQAPKPVSNMAFTSITLRWAKAAGIIIITQELARFSNPAAEGVVRNDLIEQMTQFLDRQFVDPAVAEVANVSPASITNGVTPVTPTGTNDAAFRADVKTLLNSFLTNNLSTSGGVWIGTQQQALSFSLMLNALGQPSYPTMTGEGGTLLGYPYIASENLPAAGGSPADGYPLIFAKATEIMLADDGQTVLDASNQASVQMDSAPDSPPTSSTNLVSLWQNNLTGIRCERWINWKKRRSTCVGYITNAKYA